MKCLGNDKALCQNGSGESGWFFEKWEIYAGRDVGEERIGLRVVDGDFAGLLS